MVRYPVRVRVSAVEENTDERCCERLNLTEDPMEKVGPQYELEGLRESECKRLLGALDSIGVVSSVRRYDAGRNIFLEGEPSDGLYIVSEGIVKLYKDILEREHTVLRLLGPWDIFGDLVPGASLSQGASAQAFTACEVTKIPKVFVERALKDEKEVALSLLTLFGVELVQLKDLSGCLAPRTTEARLAALLPILARRFGEVEGGEIVLLPRLTHYDLATMVASTRESVTAAMSSLRDRGFLKKEGQRISILRLKELASIDNRRVRASSADHALSADAEPETA